MVYSTFNSNLKYTSPLNSKMTVTTMSAGCIQDPRVQHPASMFNKSSCVSVMPMTITEHQQRLYQNNSRKRKLSFSGHKTSDIRQDQFLSSSSPLSVGSEDALSVFPDSPQSVVGLDSTGDDSDYSDVDEEDLDGDSSGYTISPPSAKIPKYVGTIYEQRLAPLSPVITLPVPYVNRHGVQPSVPANTTFAKQKMSSVDSSYQNKFMKLVQSGDSNQLDQFLEENGKLIDINRYNEDGVTPIQLVCQDGGSAAVAKVLVRYGADLRMTSRDGWTALHMATFSGSFALMTFIRNCPK